MAKSLNFFILMVWVLITLILIQHSVFAMTLTIEIGDAYTESYADQHIPLVFGRTNSYTVGMLSFNNYGTVWLNKSDMITTAATIPSKTYVFFTKRDAEIIERAGLIFSGTYEDYGRVTVGYSVEEEKIIRILVGCDDCSFTKKWYVAYGTSTILFRNEGVVDGVSKVEVDLL